MCKGTPPAKIQGVGVSIEKSEYIRVQKVKNWCSGIAVGKSELKTQWVVNAQEEKGKKQEGKTGGIGQEEGNIDSARKR